MVLRCFFSGFGRVSRWRWQPYSGSRVYVSRECSSRLCFAVILPRPQANKTRLLDNARGPVSRTSRNEPSETRYRTFRTIGRKTSGLRRRALLHTFVLGNGVSEHRANEMLTHSHDKRPAA